LQGLNLEIKPGQYAALVCSSESGKYSFVLSIWTNSTQNDLEKACQESYIHKFIIGLPNGYDTFIGGKEHIFLVIVLCGQKQRIAIATDLFEIQKFGIRKVVQKLDIADGKVYEQVTQQELLVPQGIYYIMKRSAWENQIYKYINLYNTAL
ncbi:13936_t:CDS:2, partial [Gigaspora rosea]